MLCPKGFSLLAEVLRLRILIQESLLLPNRATTLGQREQLTAPDRPDPVERIFEIRF